MQDRRTVRYQSSNLIIGSESELSRIESVPELVSIDKEIGYPYFKDPLTWNSEAWSRRLELPWVIDRIGPCKGLRILDVGSGASALPIFLSRKGASVVSIDPDMITGLPERKVARIQAAVPFLPFRTDSFETVCCISVLEHIPFDLSTCYAELCRIARKQVILTFDVAMSPLTAVGLSGAELRAIEKGFDVSLIFPKDLLSFSTFEKEYLGGGIAVCLMNVLRTNGTWPEIHQGKIQLTLVRLHRLLQQWVFRTRNVIRGR